MNRNEPTNGGLSPDDQPLFSQETVLSNRPGPSSDANFNDSADSSDSEFDFEAVAERFADEYRRGGRPSVDAYAAEFPAFADEIRELFPALLLLEKGGSRDSLSNFSQGASRQGFALDGFDRLKNYRLIREIGRGGMGVVYEAWDESLERTVALKVMKIFPGEEEQTIQRFQREAKMAAKLHHTNIVPVYGSDVVDDKFFYVMQLIDGVSLEEFLRLKEGEASRALRSTSRKSSQIERFLAKITKKTDADDRDDAKSDVKTVGDASFDETAALPADFSPNPADVPNVPNVAASPNAVPSANPAVPPKKLRRADRPARPGLPSANEPLLSVQVDGSNYYRRVCDLGIQAAQGLEYAHQHDVVHRDIKPSNLVVDADGVLWIADFGLAKPKDEKNLTRQGQFVGTLRYLSPEALEGAFSPASDVYSLGLTLYELLTFTPAFDEKTYSKLFGQVAAGKTTRPRKINPKIPRDLETIVLKSLERSVEKRYGSARELAEDLRRFLDERPILARRIGPLERAWRWSRRNKLVAGLLGLVAVLTLSILTVLSTAYVQTRALLTAKNVESQRAQRNLDLALDAFGDVFATLGEDVDVDFNFLSETATFGTPTDDPSITEKDARVLESLLDFYDGFARANENEATLLLKSAQAHAKIGGIRKLLGHPNDADALNKALDIYRKALAAASQTERDQIILEKATVLGIALVETGGPKSPELFEPACAETLAELAEISDDSPFAVARRNETARLRFVRAVLNVEHLRRGEMKRSGVSDASEIENVLRFLETPKILAPSAEKAREIQADFDAVSSHLDALTKSGGAQTPEYLFFVNKFYAFYSLWQATLGNADEALALQKAGLEAASTFALLYPNDSRSYVSTIIQNVFKARVDGELYGVEKVGVAPENGGVSKLYRAENQAIGAADALVAKFPNSPHYAVFQIYVRVFFAKREALAKNAAAAESLLQKADEMTRVFEETRRNYYNFRVFGPLYVGYAEFLIAANRFDEAETQIEKLETAFAQTVENAAKSVDSSDSDAERAAKNRAEIDRLRRIISERRAAVEN